jgi:hypothetical protein
MNPVPGCFHRSVLVVFSLFVVSLTGCGGGGTSGGGGPIVRPDFSLTFQPGTVSVAQNSSSSVSVSLVGSNGFNSQVNVSVSGLPAGVTASPSSFTLTTGAQQDVTISASGSAITGNSNIRVDASSGSSLHTSQVLLKVSGAPDFSIQVQPNSLSVIQNTSSKAAISVTAKNGFSSTVNITLTGVPTRVTASPVNFSINPGGHQDVTISATATAQVSVFNLLVSATSGSLAHSTQLQASVVTSFAATPPPFRTRYVRTDALHDYALTNFFPQPLTLYEPLTRRFFMSSTWLSRIDVFDAATESRIAQISIPGAFTLDESPDHGTIWVGTQVGDLYQVDPVSLTVKKRIPSIEIGPVGFAAYEVKVLADGRLALLGSQGGIPAVDGFGALGVWDPTDNSLQVYGTGYSSVWMSISNPPICGGLGNIALFDLTADRKKIILTSAFSDGTLCVFDPSTKVDRYYGVGGFVDHIFPTPDGKNIIATAGAHVTSFDAEKLFKTDEWNLQDPYAAYQYLLSPDGQTLYASLRSGSRTEVYDVNTHALKGYIPTVYIGDLISSPLPQAMDSTGLIAGIIGHGILFQDTTKLSPSMKAQSNLLTNPTYGPAQGGNAVLLSASITASETAAVYFGGAGAAFSAGAGGISATAPAGTGLADVAVVGKDGSLGYTPDGYSYGPTLLQVLPNKATVHAGGTASVYGYGFGPLYTVGGTPPSDLSITVRGRPAAIVKYSGIPPNPAWYPFPLQYIDFTIPAGTVGSSVDVTVSNSSGSATLVNSIEYLSDISTYSLSGAAIVQGIYDRKRDLYYFSDAHAVQIFSPSQKHWLSPIQVPYAGGRLWGLALSPDGKKLAVADAGLQMIYVIDPDSPANFSTFTLPNIGFNQGNRPCGIVITDSGTVYYITFSLEGSGGWLFHRLDTTTGAVTDFTSMQEGNFGADAYGRMYLTGDNARIYFNSAGFLLSFDTATEKFQFNTVVIGGDYEMTVAGNETWMASSEWLMDTNLNPLSFVSYDDREVGNVSAVYGQKLSADGNLLFQPLVSGMDVIDGHSGKLISRISLPFNLSLDYDALVSNGKDNMLVAIHENGDEIAFIDLTNLPEPNPLPFITTPLAAKLPQITSQELAQTMKKVNLASGMRSRFLTSQTTSMNLKSRRTSAKFLQGIKRNSSVSGTR